MKQNSKSLLLSIAKDRVDQTARRLVDDLGAARQAGVLAPPPKSHFEAWRDGMTWRNGYSNNPNEMLASVEAYARHLQQKVQAVRELQVAHDEIKAIPVEEESA